MYSFFNLIIIYLFKKNKTIYQYTPVCMYYITMYTFYIYIYVYIYTLYIYTHTLF